MKAKYLFCLFVSALLLSGCGGASYYAKHFVTAYYDTQSIKLEYRTAGWADREDKRDYYYVNYGYKLVRIWTISYPDDSIHEYDLGQTVGREEYLALCQKHGDTNFNRERLMGEWYRFTNCDFVSISIKSDADFDTEHLVGSELGDLVTFYASTPIEYIRNGYKGSTFSRVNKLASELTTEDMVLLGAGRDLLAELHFFSDPTLAKVHNITITMTSDDGRTFEDTIEVSWE